MSKAFWGTKEYWGMVIVLAYFTHHLMCMTVCIPKGVAAAAAGAVQAHPMLNSAFVMMAPIIIDIYVFDAREAWTRT